MGRVSSGLVDKLYWRATGNRWHCYTKDVDTKQFVSLCERMRLKRVGGQDCRRPIAVLRCGACDGREMDRRGWDESGEPSPVRSGY